MHPIAVTTSPNANGHRRTFHAADAAGATISHDGRYPAAAGPAITSANASRVAGVRTIVSATATSRTCHQGRRSVMRYAWLSGVTSAVTPDDVLHSAAIRLSVSTPPCG